MYENNLRLIIDRRHKNAIQDFFKNAIVKNVMHSYSSIWVTSMGISHQKTRCGEKQQRRVSLRVAKNGKTVN